VRSVNLFTTKEKKMKKKLYALSGVFLIVLVIAGLWATKAVNITGVAQPQDPAATSLAPGLSMQQLVEGASSIVIGTCLETKSQWVERRLVTLATVSVAETLKGDAGGNVTVVLPGGIGSKGKFQLAMTYAGAPQIYREEKVALFLVPAQDEVANGYVVMDFAQGKFSIAEDNAGEPLVTRDMTRATMQRGVGPTRGNPQSIPLAEFKALVKSYLK
jgi:hypothetical protein